MNISESIAPYASGWENYKSNESLELSNYRLNPFESLGAPYVQSLAKDAFVDLSVSELHGSKLLSCRGFRALIQFTCRLPPNYRSQEPLFTLLNLGEDVSRDSFFQRVFVASELAMLIPTVLCACSPDVVLRAEV